MYHAMFNEKFNCLNDCHRRRRRRRSPSIPVTIFYFRPTIVTHTMKRRHQQTTNMPSSLQRMMINDDHKYTVGLMQQLQKQQQPPTTPSSSSSVNHLQSSSSTIYDNNHHLQLTQKKSISSSSSRIRLGLRCLCSLDDKQQQPFDQIFSCNEQTTNISECLFEQYISRLTTNYINTLIILSGQYRETIHLQNTLVSLTLIHLHHFVNEENKSLILRISIQEFSSENSLDLLSSRGKFLLLPSDYSTVCPIQTSAQLNQFYLNHHSYPLLITFHLIARSSNQTCVQLHILSTNDNNDENKTANHQEEFSNLLMSLSLSLPSNRQKQSFHLSDKRNSHEQSLFSLTSILNEYVIQLEDHFLYILATVKNNQQLKYWSKIQRLFKTKRNRLKMSRDSTSIETVINRPHEEIWVDGPLSSSRHKNEIWIDGPRKLSPRSPKISSQKSTPKHRCKPLHTKPKLPSGFPSYAQHEMDDSRSSNAFDTESIVSSHCHLPVLPVFKDHSLLPFRANQTLTKTKPLVSDTTKLNLKLSTNKLNDDLEMLEKTLETLLVPSPIVPVNTDTESPMSKSLNRIDQLSSLMSNDEKSKRLSRIVSPTRFEKILSPDNHYPSVPNSPLIVPRTRRSRTSNKPQVPLRTTSLAETTSRPSIFQRLFGLRSSHPQQSIVIQSPPSSPLISPLTVTLDSHDDLMPLTTSSTASSASGRASSSGYESMSNTILEEMLASMPSNMTNANNSIKIRNKSTRKEDRRSNSNGSWGSPVIRDKSNHPHRLFQLKHRQSELKLELAMTKTFLLMDKSKNPDRLDSLNPTIPNSPIHTLLSNNYDEEHELEKDIEYLERRLLSAKSQLMFPNYEKNKPLIS